MVLSGVIPDFSRGGGTEFDAPEKNLGFNQFASEAREKFPCPLPSENTEGGQGKIFSFKINFYF